MMTSDGNRNPENADTGGDQDGRIVDLIDQACLDHAVAERNSTVSRAVENQSGTTTVEVGSAAAASGEPGHVGGPESSSWPSK
jgi:hypothetical protein